MAANAVRKASADKPSAHGSCREHHLSNPPNTLVKICDCADVAGTATRQPARTLLSVLVLVSSSMPDGSLLVRNSVLSVYGSVQLATSTDYYFGSDNVALRATFRFGQKIADTARVVKLTVVSPGS